MSVRALFEELFNDDEGIACVHVRPFSDHDLLHDAFLWCLQFILHLHGFHHNYPLAALRPHPSLLPEREQLCRAWAPLVLQARCDGPRGTTASQRARVMDLDEYRAEPRMTWVSPLSARSRLIS